MKIAYCIESTYNSGGMERVLSMKANYLCEKLGYDVYVITTDQGGHSNFFYFSDRIKFIDLDVGYKELDGKPFVRKVPLYWKKRRIHYAKLSNVLAGLNADIVISMFGKETSMLWRMKDGSKKILELHFSKYLRLMVQQSASMKVVNLFRTFMDDIFARRYDRLIVLTQEDGMSWKKFRNLMVIPNPTFMHPDCPAALENKRVIAVGRLCYQKGFDMLVSAWALVHPSEPDWHLDIYGQGEWKESLERQITECGLDASISIHQPVTDIQSIYLESSILALTSRYEGFGLVLTEAIGCGVPVVSFACKCGPRDIIKDGHNGFLVRENDVKGLAGKLLHLMRHQDMRKEMGKNAMESAQEYDMEIIMKKWDDVFKSLL